MLLANLIYIFIRLNRSFGSGAGSSLFPSHYFSFFEGRSCGFIMVTVWSFPRGLCCLSSLSSSRQTTSPQSSIGLFMPEEVRLHRKKSLCSTFFCLFLMSRLSLFHTSSSMAYHCVSPLHTLLYPHHLLAFMDNFIVFYAIFLPEATSVWKAILSSLGVTTLRVLFMVSLSRAFCCVRVDS